MDRLRVALSGLQHSHIEQVIGAVERRPDRLAIVAVAEVEADVRDRYQAWLDVSAYASHRDMLDRERPDVVAVAAANGDRGEMVVDALGAGAHVVVDKPLCTTLGQLDAIESAWRGSGLRLGLLLEKRRMAETTAVDGLLAERGLGDVVLAWASAPHRLRRAGRPAWMFDRDGYGGILNDLAVHDVDLLLHFTGAGACEIQGWTGNRAHPDLSEFEDHGLIYMRTDTGLLATISVDWLSPEASEWHGDYRVMLTGTEGTAEIRFATGEVTVATHREPPHRLPLGAPQAAADDFFDSVLDEVDAAITTEQALRATRVALTAQAHANDGRWHRCP